MEMGAFPSWGLPFLQKAAGRFLVAVLYPQPFQYALPLPEGFAIPQSPRCGDLAISFLPCVSPKSVRRQLWRSPVLGQCIFLRM